MVEYEQRSYHNWKNNKRREAIGVIITLPKKYVYVFDEIHLAFVDKDFMSDIPID